MQWILLCRFRNWLRSVPTQHVRPEDQRIEANPRQVLHEHAAGSNVLFPIREQNRGAEGELKFRFRERRSPQEESGEHQPS